MNAHDVAEFLLHLADQDSNNNDITNLKLQKLVYYVQGFHLAMHDVALFPDKISAWQYGPVVADLYQLYKKNGNNVISPDPDYVPTAEPTPAQVELMQEVFDVYGQFSAWKLRDMTHEETPWREASRANVDEISPEAMKDYFKQQLTSVA